MDTTRTCTITPSELRKNAELKIALLPAIVSIPDLDSRYLLHELQVQRIELEIQNEDLLRQCEHLSHLENIIKVTPAGYFHIDPEGHILEVNKAWLDMHGYESSDEVVGKHFSMMQVDSTSMSALTHLAELKRGNPIPYGEFTRLRKDGSIGHHIFSVHPVVHLDSVVGYEWFIIDISEHMLVESIQGHYSAIIRSSSDAIIGKNLDGCITSWNPAAERVFGYNESEMLGQPMTLLIPPERMNEEQLILEKVCQGEYIDHFETVRRRKNGELFPISVTISPIKDGSGTIIGATKIARDITVSKNAESQLRIAAVAFESHEGIVVTDANEIILRCNRAFTTITGYECEEVIGKRMNILKSDRHDEPFFADMWCVIKRDGAWRGAIWNRIKNGSTRLHEITISEVRDSDNIVINYVGKYTDTTERRLAEQALADSETRLRAVLDGVQSAVITITEKGIIESFNYSAEILFGYSSAEVLGKNILMLIPEPHKSKHDSYLKDYLRDGIRTIIGGRRDVFALRKGELSFHAELGVSETVLNDTKLFIGSITDISFRKEAEAELRIAATAFESLTGMVVTDADGTILRVNRAFSEISGYSEAEVIGKNPRILKSGRHNVNFYRNMWEEIERDGGWKGEIWDRRKNGEEFPKWLTISAVKGNDGTTTNYIGTHYDLSEQKRTEQQIDNLAYYDQLTGLPNRTLLLDRLKQAMTASDRNGSYGSLLFIDLDNFKALNDAQGHEIGDILLQQVAQRLTVSVQAEDTVARLGGDEFVVMVVGLSVDKKAAATKAEILVEVILGVLNQPYQLMDTTYHSTPSIGINLFRDHQTEIETLIKQAEIAMYKSKDGGRNTVRFFDQEMETAVMERASLEKDLREAIRLRQFVLHYQPQVAGGQLVGSEALVRWQHPHRGIVSPASFIPLAEETNLILPLGQWVLEAACEQLARWATRPEMSHLTVAVNVSALQFHDPGFVDQVLAVLNKTGANPYRLKLELTESLLVTKVDDIIEKMYVLKSKGVGFSLDDFGTGYSSLSYLKRLPLDQLKIDQSFVRDILIDPNDAAIAKTIIALAHSLGFAVIAEGVETADQRDFLAHSGCHAYQGYYFSRPLPVESFDAYAIRK